MWDVWLAAVLGSFAALEVYAFRSGRLPTLTRVLRAHLGLSPRCRRGSFTPVLLTGFCVWFVGHLVELQLRALVRRSGR